MAYNYFCFGEGSISIISIMHRIYISNNCMAHLQDYYLVVNTFKRIRYIQKIMHYSVNILINV